MATLLGFISRMYSILNPPSPPPLAGSKPIKFGILGAAAIAPSALIIPAQSHPEVLIHAVAARDLGRANTFAKKHGIGKVYGGLNGYQEMLDDPEIDAIYNPLPNGLHYEWTMKALAAGKHVLVEKPSANTAGETRLMFELAESKGLVLLESLHYRFHPAIQRMKAIIDSGELGKIKSISTFLTIPQGFVKPGDIRLDLELGGGGLMDMGCYTLDCIRYLASRNPTSIISAQHELYTPPSAPSSFAPNIDRGTMVTFALPNDITASLTCDMGKPLTYGIFPPIPQVRAIVSCDGGDVELYNFVLPTLYHSLTIRTRSGEGYKKRVEKVYTFSDGKMRGKGEAWWLTWRYQLEAFVDKLKGREPQTWVSKEDSISNMEWIEKIYETTGLGSRPRSQFTS